MAASLYRKYRPQRFSELVGQEHVARALQNALSEDRLAHAYLFSGTRGTGKTSSARILGAVLNCKTFTSGYPSESGEIEPCGECESCVAARAGNSFDVIELDAASNNGVDDMRELIEKVSYTSAAGGTKVYIIDEVHELTGRASNALLKTLEEPPEHVVFILATTNPEKVLPTIRSRTQHFEFVSLPEDKLFNHAKEILSWEERTLDDDAVHFVAHKGAGSVRDMLSYLDQVLALEVSTMAELEAATASSETPTILELIVSASAGDVGQTLASLHSISSQGKEPRAIVENIISVARDCLVVSLNPETSILLSNHTDKDELKNVGDKCGTNFLRQFILKLGKAVADMRGTASLNPLLNVEIALLATMGGMSGESVGVDASSPGRSHAVPAQRPRHDKEASPTSSTGSAPRPKAAAPSTAPVEAAEAQPAPKQDARAGEARKSYRTDQPASEEPRKAPGTLGALKKQGVTEAPAAEAAKPAKKLSVRDVQAEWAKVVSLLSPASQESIKKANPIKLDGDVLTFGVAPDEMDDVKARFKKDAAIIRGFLESLFEKSFRFQIVADEAAAAAQAKEEINLRKEEEKMLSESEEYNPVDAVVSMFGGEIVEGN